MTVNQFQMKQLLDAAFAKDSRLTKWECNRIKGYKDRGMHTSEKLGQLSSREHEIFEECLAKLNHNK